MSYCRFGWDNSSVYIFENVSGWLECCGCGLDRDIKWDYRDIAEFLAHLDEHEARGDVVPPTVRTEIIQDWQQGRFAEWDQTDPVQMVPYLALPPVTDPRTYVEFLSENRHMLGWDDEKFDHFKQLMEEKEREGRSQAADRPAEERDPGD